MASPFVTLPREVIERVLIACHDPRDIAHFAQTCRAARELVYNAHDQFLWRELFLAQPFDDLRKALPTKRSQIADYNWAHELQRRVAAEAAVTSSTDVPDATLVAALGTLISLVETSAPASPEPGPPLSHNLIWLDGVLRRAQVDASSLSTPEAQERWARLRAYAALAHAEPRACEALRRVSRCFVYDLRRYTAATAWGPFVRRAGGGLGADWVHVEHVVNVVTLKLREHALLRIFGRPLSGVHATRAYSAPGSLKRAPRDWAGVTGTWRRFVCFMDYRDLFAFNFSLFQESPPQGPLDPSFFDHGYQEAIRPIEVRLELIDDHAEDGMDTDEAFPEIHFKGCSRGPHSIDAIVEGSVSMLEDGAIRWRFTTKYDGLTQWSAEGIQLGNVCSAAGIAGIWTGAFHEEADPAGPFLMWKTSGRLRE
ncbi:hypothetical protein OBBRIDRAFT_833245 [Obba rivulosa]|uniref:F-box domain-containing protein n=1 Tax=Obba rivulosa TaxID=1052685 RepID=A0A8E2DMW4_9APHY|nr:hypothetical protein OBBRIDRAFT_833245 [Obba rivulosa]